MRLVTSAIQSANAPRIEQTVIIIVYQVHLSIHVVWLFINWVIGSEEMVPRRHYTLHVHAAPGWDTVRMQDL